MTLTTISHFIDNCRPHQPSEQGGITGADRWFGCGVFTDKNKWCVTIDLINVIAELDFVTS